MINVELLNYYLDVAIQSAIEAGAYLLNRFGEDHSPIYKSEFDVGLLIDKDSEKIILHKILNEFPSHNIFSEEIGGIKNKSDFTWYIDPLDGTKEFIEGVDHFVVSVALVEKGEPIVGVLYNPASDELFSATKGDGAFLDGERLNCSTKTDFKKMVILNSRSETRNGLWEPYASDFQEQRPIGSVAYKLGLTSAAKADIFASLRPKNEWDICAGHCILREAGGEMVNLGGKPITYNNPKTLITPGLIASNVDILEDSINLFKRKK